MVGSPRASRHHTGGTSTGAAARDAGGVLTCAPVSAADVTPAPHPARWLVLFGVWLIYCAFGLVASSLAPLVHRIESDLDMSHAAIGSVMGAWQLVFIAAAIPCGIALDRLGTRRALLLGAACIALSAYGRSVASNYGELLAAVMLFGVGGPVVSAGAPKVIAEWFDGASRGLAMGIYITGPAVGGVLALALTNGVLLPHFSDDWRPIFVVWAGFTTLAGLVWWVIASLPSVRPHTAPRPAAAGLPHRAVLLALIARKPVRLILAMALGTFMLGHGLHNWLPAILAGTGMSAAEAGYWAAIPTVVGIVGSLLIPRLAVPARRYVILAVLAAALLASTVLLQFDARLPVLCGLILQGIGRSSLMTVLILILVELPGIDARSAGTATGLFFATAEVGGMLGPLGVGILYDVTHGFAAGLGFFTVIAALFLLAVRPLRTLARN